MTVHTEEFDYNRAESFTNELFQIILTIPYIFLPNALQFNINVVVSQNIANGE